MSSQTHAGHIGHQGHAHLDHVLTGLQHLRVTLRERINLLEEEREDLELQRAALAREFHEHADIHDVRYRILEGYEDKTYPVESQMERARHHFWGMAAGMSIAVVLGVYFSMSTMMADSAALLCLGSVLVAVGVGKVASHILTALLGTSAVKPRAAVSLNAVTAAVGVIFFALVGAFALLRFQTDSPLVALLPALMVGMELSAILFAGACDCGYRMYRWSGVFHERHRRLLHREAEVEDQLATRHVDLLSVEHRIKEHEEARRHGHHAADHHADGHGADAPAEGHHELHYEALHR